MVPPNIPSNLPNLVAPFLPAGQRPVGQESLESRKSTFKPVEQLPEAAHAQVQLKEHPGERQHGQRREDGQDSGGVAGMNGSNDDQEQCLDVTQRNALDQDLVQLYGVTKLGRGQNPPAPRGCLLDDTV